MVLERLNRISPILARIILDLALIVVAASVLLNGLAYNRLLHIAIQNNHNGNVIKAATGCADTDSVAVCKTKIAAQSQIQIGGYLRQTDCWTRRALANLPPPTDYATPCIYPK